MSSEEIRPNKDFFSGRLHFKICLTFQSMKNRQNLTF